MERRNGNKDQSERSSLSSKKGMQESKPCEVCGSVGIAGLMMICVKCRDTREHIYCARVLLPSVPPMWLCEACRSSSRVVIISTVAEDLMDSETSVADRSSDPESFHNSRVNDHGTAKLSTNDIEEVVDAGITLPVTLQASTTDSSYEISANVSRVNHHLPLQPHTSPQAKETSPVLNDSSQNKEQHLPSQAFPKKRRTIRLMGKHLSQSHRTLISSRDPSLTEGP